MLESANRSKESVSEYFKPLFHDNAGPGKGQNDPIAGRCRKT